MFQRLAPALTALVLSLSLAACGGGGSTTTIFNPGPSTGGTITIAPGSLSFAAPGAAAQTFTISSSAGAVPAPTIDSFGCAPIATITTNSTTLPATYTVTPQGNGSCSVVARLGGSAAGLGIMVGGAGAPVLNGSTSTINLFAGGSSGSVTVTASAGTLTPDATACAGIASIAGGGGASPQTFTVTPVAAGSCTLVIVDGAGTLSVPITVNANPNGPNQLVLSPTSMTFSSPSAGTQQGTLTFTGSVGQVSIDETDCTGGAGGTSKTKVAFLTLNGVPPGSPVTLPVSFTVTLYGNVTGSQQVCTIKFLGTPSTIESDLSIIVNP